MHLKHFLANRGDLDTVHTEFLKKSEVEEKILREVPDVFDKWFEETLARNLAFQSGPPKK